jgi:hypothetical protein
MWSGVSISHSGPGGLCIYINKKRHPLVTRMLFGNFRSFESLLRPRYSIANRLVYQNARTGSIRKKRKECPILIIYRPVRSIKACKLHISIVHTSFFSTFLPLLEKCEKTCHLHPFRYERRKQKEEIPTRGIEPRPPRTWLCCDEETRYESEKS